MTPRRAIGQHDANLNAVLARIGFAPEPPSRAAISEYTGLTRAAVSLLVDELVQAGVVTELAPSRSGNTGRPAVPLAPAPGTYVGLGLDVRVDEIGARAVDLTGATMAEAILPGDFRETDPRSATIALLELAEEVIASVKQQDAQIVGTALSIPGFVHAGTGEVMEAPNLGWHNVDVMGLLKAEPVLPAVPLHIGNDANFAAELETWLRLQQCRGGAPEPSGTYIYLAGTVGFGAALVHDSRIYHGNNGWSMEIGHVCVQPDGPRCACGATGCLELYAGRYRMLEAAGLPQWAGTAEIKAAAASGDERAQAAIKQAGTAIGLVLSSVVSLLDVPEVVLGGELGQLTEVLRPYIAAEINLRVVSAAWQDVTVTASLIDGFDPLSGAALSIVQDALRNPGRMILSTPRVSG